MPAGTVLDWSGWRPTDAVLAQMRSLGIVGCVRYPYLGPGTEWKTCYPDEYKRIRDAGLQIAFTPELSKSTWRGGRNAGIDIGRKARYWVQGLGFPDDRPLHFAVDENVLPSELNLALDFLGGCGEGGGQGAQSCYGETSVIDAAFERGITRNGWRAAATSWDTNPSKHASMRQTTQQSYPFAGAYDENIIISPDWGQHPAPDGGAMALAPYSLWKNADGKVWRVDAGAQSKVLVPDQPQIDWNLAVLRINGYPENQLQVGVVGTNATLKTWLDAIPDGNYYPAPPPAGVDVGAIVNAVNADLGRRIVNG